MDYSPAEIEEALKHCAEEPIHHIGSVQSFSLLLCLDGSTETVLQASDNTASIAALSLDQVLNAHLTDLFTPDTVARIRQQLQPDSGEGIKGLPIHWKHAPEDSHYGLLHPSGKWIFLEIEKGSGGSSIDFTDFYRAISSRTRSTELLDYVTRQIKELLGYDRVMAYRFEEDYSGEVVAEAANLDLDSFLGLHYPAEDIPEQARRLFILNKARILADRDAPEARLAPSGSEPVDLSSVQSRSHSKVHLQYFQNMGVCASLSIALTVQGRLWGLIACHHYKAKALPTRVRLQLQTLSDILSNHLSLLEKQTLLSEELQRSQLTNRLIQSIAVAANWPDVVMSLSRELLQAFKADGVALCFEDKIQTAGITPPVERILPIARALGENNTDYILQTDALGHRFPEFSDLQPLCAGVLAAKLSRQLPHYLMIFREEKQMHISWAGKPEKKIEVQSGILRLQPRESFNAWIQAVEGKSTPWKAAKIEMMKTIRSALVEIVLTAYYLHRDVLKTGKE